mgnify:CR=1 FL=1
MELAITNNIRKIKLFSKADKVVGKNPNITEVELNRPFTIKGVDTSDSNIKEFLFTLGCYEGVEITVISALAENYVINIKDARYSIDEDLAKAILI